MTPDAYTRFMSKVKIDPTSGCWIWTGAILQSMSAPYRVSGGYGIAEVDGHTRRAHRASYEHAVGPIPDGLTLDHTCHTRDEACAGGSACLHRRCVNPEHLTLATRRQNVLLGNTIPSKNAAKTHCDAGHEFTPDNTRVRRQRNGGAGYSRECRECERERRRASYLRQNPDRRPRGPYTRRATTDE